MKPDRIGKSHFKKGNEVIRVRRGVDKVLIAVIPKKFQEVKYDREIALSHQDRYKRLKFGRRKWGGFLYYPLGEWDGTPLISYYVPLKGFLRVLVMVNLMRYYNYSHGYKPPRRISLWDNNIVKPSEHFEIDWFIEALISLKEKIISDVSKLIDFVYDEKYSMIDADVIVQQIEITEEAIGLDIVDIKQVYKHTRATKIERWSNSTGTVYLNGGNKEQVKFYQKGIGVLRCEFCLNDKSVCLDLSDKAQTKLSLEVAISRLCERIDLSRKWWENVRYPEKEELWQLLASTLGVDLLLLKRIVSLDVWDSTTAHELTTRKLLRKGLITKVKRGLYVPSDKLRLFTNMLNTLSEPT